MIRLSDLAKLGRPVRQDDAADLGRPTQALVDEAVEAGRADEAKALARYMIPEGKPLHDLFCDWVWNLLTYIADRHGEEEVYQALRASQGGWMMRRTWRGFLGLSVKERVDLTAEVMRAHRCGPAQDGELSVVEDEEKFSIVMDPCGSGGRMRRGDPVDGTPSRLGPPYDFGVTKTAHPWSFGRKEVPYYCVHCALNEKLPMEWGGHPLWVTDYDPDPSRPCAWVFYKRAEDIPERYYARAGHRKPDAGQGDY
jgi:hypothetical protein